MFERLYGKFLDPRDATGQTRLGRAPQRFRPVEEVYAVLAALEPGATSERRAELMIEAKMQVRTPVLYFDATFSVSKSITLLHASAMANAAKAASEGDLEAAAYWEQAAADVWACIEAGNPSMSGSVVAAFRAATCADDPLLCGCMSWTLNRCVTEPR